MTMSIISSTPPVSTTFRDLAAQITPTYLRGPWGTKWIYTHAIIFDALADGMAFAACAGLPQVAPPDGLQWLALDRQIDQGPNEPSTSFRLRLTQWLDLWLTAGSQRGILRALGSYLTPGSYTVETVNDTIAANSTTYTAWDSSTAQADPPTHYLESPGNWYWDSLNIPGRSWVIIYGGPWTQGPTWGSFNWGDGTVWGMSGGNPPNDAASIRGLVKKWKSAGDFVCEVIVAFDSSWYVPTLTYPNAKLPDGTWHYWGKVATETESYGLWGNVTSTTGLLQGAWGQVVTQQVPGAQGTPIFARVYTPLSSRTTNSAGTVAQSYTPLSSRTTTTATSVRGYVPSRPATSCFLGPVL